MRHFSEMSRISRICDEMRTCFVAEAHQWARPQRPLVTRSPLLTTSERVQLCGCRALPLPSVDATRPRGCALDAACAFFSKVAFESSGLGEPISRSVQC